MNAKFEIAPTLLNDAVEVFHDAQRYYEADASALARMGGPMALALAEDRLAWAKKAGELLAFFAQQ